MRAECPTTNAPATNETREQDGRPEAVELGGAEEQRAIGARVRGMCGTACRLVPISETLLENMVEDLPPGLPVEVAVDGFVSRGLALPAHERIMAATLVASEGGTHCLERGLEAFAKSCIGLSAYYPRFDDPCRP